MAEFVRDAQGGGDAGASVDVDNGVAVVVVGTKLHVGVVAPASFGPLLRLRWRYGSLVAIEHFRG